jgi:hypothetical protein
VTAVEKSKLMQQADLRLQILALEEEIAEADRDGWKRIAADLRCELADLQDELKELESDP